MRQVGSCECLLPPGLNVDEIRIGAEGVFVSARMPGGVARCPSCGSMSGRIHSRYRRALSDLPAHGRRVRVELLVRRFRCPVRSCRVKIFAERPGDGITQRYGRRTTRLQGLVRCLGLALGGRPAQALANRLLLPLSKDTLLRSIRSGIPTPEAAPPPRIIGIDDWAWKNGHRYGTIICDLERR